MTDVDHTRDICDRCGGVLLMPSDPSLSPSHFCGTLDVLNGCDWQEVFKYSEGEWLSVPGSLGRSDRPFTREDVDSIYAYSEGENDAYAWIMLGRLKDGLFFFIEARCDYTGWGCREDGRSYVFDDLTRLISFGMTKEYRDRLRPDLDRIGYEEPGS